MHERERIKLHMTLGDIAVVMSEEHPGALTVVLDLVTKGPVIDPEAWAPIAPVLDLDTLGVRGSRIWVLYDCVCQRNLVTLMALLRAVQLGFMEERELLSTIDAAERGDRWSINSNGALHQVCERLPRFGQVTENARVAP